MKFHDDELSPKNLCFLLFSQKLFGISERGKKKERKTSNCTHGNRPLSTNAKFIGPQGAIFSV